MINVNEEIYIVAATRTAVGSFGGALRSVPPVELATRAVKDAVSRAQVDPAAVGHVTMGQVIATDAHDIYMSRVAALRAGMPATVSAFNVNRLCGSGLQAIISSAQMIAAGAVDMAVGAGAESMSRSGYLSQSTRWGARLGDQVMQDMLVQALHDPFKHIHMGVTAENVAKRHGITRQMMDELALTSQQRAARAQSEGRFREQIVTVEVTGKKGVQIVEQDEQIRPETSLDELARLKPVFLKEDGRVTAGNASSMNDGAAAVLLASAAAVQTHGLRPLARLAGYAFAGVEPDLMGLGPVPATRRVLKQLGLRVSDMDVIESNEAFAAQACAVSQLLELDPDKVNPNGSGISLGHPVGATGVIITIKALYELHRTRGRYALATMCIGGGQGIAAVFERC